MAHRVWLIDKCMWKVKEVKNGMKKRGRSKG